MKTRSWILLFALISALCIILSVVFFCKTGKNNTALIYSDGALILTVDLQKNAEYRVDFGKEWNILTVKDGKISVTVSSCASHDCIRQGRRNNGAPIVCLPNHLVIEFADTDTLDAILR